MFLAVHIFWHCGLSC